MLSTEIAQDIYTNSLSLVNFINNYTAKENLPQDQINAAENELYGALIDVGEFYWEQGSERVGSESYNNLLYTSMWL